MARDQRAYNQAYYAAHKDDPEYRRKRADTKREWKKTETGKLAQARENRSLAGRYKALKYIAKQRGYECQLSKADLAYLVMQPCHYCGQPLSQTGCGLDRVNNSVGYSLGNVVPCCAACNKIKGDNLTYAEMKVAMAAVLEHRSRFVIPQS